MSNQTVSTATGAPNTSYNQGNYRPGLLGEIFYGEHFSSLDQALAAMLSGPDAFFVSSSPYYDVTGGSLENLLQDDAASLSDEAAASAYDQFALRMTGQIYLEAGTHDFYSCSDDGFRLTIDGKIIAEYGDMRAVDMTDGQITVSESGWYDIRIDYFEAVGDAGLLVEHSYNGGPVSTLSPDLLRYSNNPQPDPDTPPTNDDAYAAGLKGSVYMLDGPVSSIDEALAEAVGQPDAEFTSSQVYYPETTGDLASMLGRDAGSLTDDRVGELYDLYALTLEGQIYLDAGETRFGAMTDDGFRLTINGSVVAEYEHPRPMRGTAGKIWVAEAGWYDIRLDYFENVSVSGLKLGYATGDDPFRMISPDRLRHSADDVNPPPVNSAPVAGDDSGFVGTAGDVVIISFADLMANDSDADGDALTITSITNVQNGSAKIVGDAIHFAGTSEGPASFEYVLSDGQGGQDRGSVALTIEAESTPENTAPVAADDSGFDGTAGEAVIITFAELLANDSDADGDGLSIVSLTNVQNGLAKIVGDAVHFTGTSEGPASFEYVLSDGQGGRDTASVSLTIEPDVAEPTNTAPIAQDDSGYSGNAGSVIMISIAELLANDSDADGDALTIASITNVQNGSATIMNGMIHFTGNGAGPASFDYVLSDGRGGQDTGSVSLSIAAADGPGGGGGDGGHHGGNGDFEMIDVPETQAEIDAFVAMVRAMPEDHGNMDDPDRMEEHMGAVELVPRAEATHIAINHGDWNDPSTWHNGEVPGENARVLVPEGVMVTYSEVNDASIFTVRVDGMLTFATDQDSRLLVDTMVVSQTGFLVIGTEDDPVEPDVNVDIVFADNGDIDVGWDAMLLSRGMIAMGSTSIHGTEKTSHLKVDVDAMAGDNTLVLEDAPTGWEVGDKLVLTGTYQQGWYWDNDSRSMQQAESQDEEVYITAINGNVITLNRGLTFDHDTPRDDLKAYVANMTRNVSFSNEAGDDLPVHQRGHVMFMHSDDVDVRYAGFVDLGRTDKSVSSLPLDVAGGPGNLEADTNLQSRYSFHLHEAGVSDIENPAIVIGNVVDGAPGWGYVHHSSNANFTNNVAFDVFGAAFVAEDGNETGIWNHNIAIKSVGVAYGVNGVKEGAGGDFRDDGRTGDGFFFGGRLVEAADNVAANTNNGYVWFHRYVRDSVDPDTMYQPEVALGRDTLLADQPVIQGFRDNEAFGTTTGLIVLKASPDQGHDLRSVFDGFLNWETREGINLSYTSHYTLLDVDLVGQRAGHGPSDETFHGIELGGNAYDIVFNGLQIDGFDVGVDLTQNRSDDGVALDLLGNTVIDAAFLNIGSEDVRELQPGVLAILTSDDLTPGRMDFDYRGVTTLLPQMDMLFLGTKTDSIGSVDRSFYSDPQGLYSYDVGNFLEENGYHRLPDGTPVVVVADYVTDRATGELTKISHVIRLDYPESDLNSRFPYNGVIDPDGAPPVVRNDSATTSQNADVVIDLVGNDSSPRGLDVFVDGLTNPTYGDVYLQDDGTVLYRPDPDFTGTDTFYYWANDGQGNYVRGVATVTVSSALQASMMSDGFEF